MPVNTLSGPIPGTALYTATGPGAQVVDPGMNIQVGTNIGAASGAPNTLPQTPVFVIGPGAVGVDRTLGVSAVGIGAVPTTVTANLLASYDSGVTWQPFETNIALVAAGVAAVFEAIHMTAGCLYAFSLSALTLGGASGVNINVTLS